MNTTLLIMAAGLGSRYGGNKQIDRIGPNGEILMEYSIHDAVEAGFDKVVFVIRKSMAETFREMIGDKIAKKVEVAYAFQEYDTLPDGFVPPADRAKPYGTVHAVVCAKDKIHEPFAVINADDFYGKESYQVLADFLRSVEGKQGQYCMVGYRVANTLSENGSVSRGVCTTNAEGLLTDVVERTQIEDKNGTIVYTIDGVDTPLDPHTPVSMNMWGFTPEYFQYSEEAFRAFLAQKGQELKSEFYIPTLVNDLIAAGKATCKVLDTPSKWFGVTYSEDRPQVVMKINHLIKEGVYPEKLF